MFKKSKKVEEAAVEEEVKEVFTQEDLDIATDEVLAEEAALAEEAPIRAGIKYNGAEVVERLEGSNDDGQLCRLSDGTTAYVPQSILGDFKNE